MQSIKSKTVYEQEIKKSRFISVLAPVFSETDAKNFIEIIKKEYPGATHYTYAYILGDNGVVQKASDDGEPTRTAGYPILEVLLKNHLTDIIAIVIRYFGGIKLGKGGLIRAYSGSVSEGLKQAVFTKKTTTYDCQVETIYDNIGPIDRFLRENTVLSNVVYDQEITFFFTVNSADFDTVKEQLVNRNNYQDRIKILKSHTEYV